ncbi:MAG: maleylpyruvate isomerase family mycothiol-dependent enzyme [Armatimonadetes bacterium]|nr:MAG: maleylpyruvate isomerase family mycothiol-dependent enzyme [Armatimonadota bacterium]
MYAATYRAGQQRLIAFMDGKDPDRVVPACPDWTATDVVRHLAGISADAANLVFEGFASDEWTDAQVSARQSMSLGEVIAEWNGTIDDALTVLETIDSQNVGDFIMSAFGPIPPAILPATAVSDLMHHEFDIRNAYGDTNERDRPEVHVVAAGHARSLRPMFAALRLPTLRIEATDSGQDWNIGRDEPVATVRASSFEIMRGIGGRRTRDEMLAWNWDGDAEVFVDSMVLPHLAMRDRSLNE